MEGKVDQEKPKRGAPKLPWGPFDDELYRRLTTGLAKVTVKDEAMELEKWAKKNQYCTKQGKYQKWERIRDRILKRYKGAQGYRNTREHFLGLLLAKAEDAGIK